MRLRKTRLAWSNGFQAPAAGTCMCCKRLQCSTTRAALSTDVSVEKLLDNYWEARGVFDPEQRKRLVDSAKNITPVPGGVALQPNQPLPGIPATWSEADTIPEVAEVSRRLLQLQQILGGENGDLDVVWMVVREPRLLTADYVMLTQRLFQMKIALGSSGVDVLKVVAKQPSLLLQDESSVNADNLQDLLRAWEYGLTADGDREWSEKLQELREYKERVGDAHVGFRDGDSMELARWASKQRAAWRAKELQTAKQEKLEAIGFEFNEDEAEWLRWYKDLVQYKEANGHCSPPPLAAGVDFYLINWCSVQRVAMRTRVLSEQRIRLLDSIGFDWTGADPLS